MKIIWGDSPRWELWQWQWDLWPRSLFQLFTMLLHEILVSPVGHTLTPQFGIGLSSWCFQAAKSNSCRQAWVTAICSTIIWHLKSLVLTLSCFDWEQVHWAV